ncbi:MAG TPA: type II toxin-antitoxin system RelE/ParE family toxin [Pyrinomonadaceae bacterium]|nr:type II toxin-antitoxin system RelE/ParE family toxin [Pyrinomonadaceae bacterium]
MRIVRSSQTYEDIVEIAAWLGAEDEAVALRFFDQYESTLEAISKTPKIGAPRRSLSGINFRLWFVDGFEMVLILYEDQPEEIRILRVIHSARDYNRFI